MALLPVEILHRIFGLLPPSTFYLTIPRVSCQFRPTAYDIHSRMSCPGDTIGVCYCVTVVGDDAYSHPPGGAGVGRIDVVTMLGERYRRVRDDAVWMALEIEDVVPASAVVDSRSLGNLIPGKIPDCLSQFNAGGSNLARRLGPSVVSRVCVGFLEDVDVERGVFQYAVEFVQEHDVPEVNLGGDYRTLLRSLPPDANCDSVVSVRADSRDEEFFVHGDFPDGHDMLPTLVVHFPSVTTLQGSCMFVLLDYPNIEISFEAEMCVVRLPVFNTQRMLPDMTELGILTMFRWSEEWNRLLTEYDPDGDPLKKVKTFHMDVKIIAQCIKDLMRMLPHVELITLTIAIDGIKVTIENIELLAFFLSELFKRIPSTCVFKI
ncbi:hypothetical protein M427DRAFT_154075 [Gonapodya prolifera JEL478]|uniref:F-box domain-containing protein n=1 Tax=Gonapodya prolifera (strain JEL478) TaxID=1344416 RepID=A0A139AK89_GONPJ|nr:hypothetical protein M427DRAFT_154075 [Gonapodya prolifera JEL478]|eukprot:KXS16923.1 hypothetical protein M427DRAFT_154075 [Gonapodya prolifera JEL478]